MNRPRQTDLQHMQLYCVHLQIASMASQIAYFDCTSRYECGMVIRIRCYLQLSKCTVAGPPSQYPKVCEFTSNGVSLAGAGASPANCDLLENKDSQHLSAWQRMDILPWFKTVVAFAATKDVQIPHTRSLHEGRLDLGTFWSYTNALHSEDILL